MEKVENNGENKKENSNCQKNEGYCFLVATDFGCHVAHVFVVEKSECSESTKDKKSILVVVQ